MPKRVERIAYVSRDALYEPLLPDPTEDALARQRLDNREVEFRFLPCKSEPRTKPSLNLGGEKIYAVADILADRKIPFALVTGYGPESIVSAFSHAPVLQKPVEAAKLHALLQQIMR